MACSFDRRAAIALRGMARRLELRSVGLSPEYFSRTEGLRAALAVGAPLILTVAMGRLELGWSIFAAFWTCLSDSPGPDRLRRRLLGSFVALGTLIAFAGSWLASLGISAAIMVAPFLVLVIVLAASRVAHASLVGTLLAVVAVVAGGFPHPIEQAAIQAAAFFAGAAWAYILINTVWRIDPVNPLRHGSDAVVARLRDWAADLVATGKGAHRDEHWHSGHAQHRRAVRMALERLRALIGKYQDEPEASIDPFMRAWHAAENMFSALIALDHAFITRQGPANERIAVARASRLALSGFRVAMDPDPLNTQALQRRIERLHRLSAQLTDELMIGCVVGYEDTLAMLKEARTGLDRAIFNQGGTPLSAGLKAALRPSVGVVTVLYLAEVFHLGYPYWATMAVVVVLQGGVRVTWTRCAERIFGSLVGGFIAVGLLHAGAGQWLLSGVAVALAGITIALRMVNYTVFVVFLSMLFIIVTEMLHPATGIASARMLDNLIGSLAALTAVLALWPDWGPSLKTRIASGLQANQAYYDAVRQGEPRMAVRAARRAAGLASIEAELALYDLGGLRQYFFASGHAPELIALRTVSGEAAAAWQRYRARA